MRAGRVVLLPLLPLCAAMVFCGWLPAAQGAEVEFVQAQGVAAILNGNQAVARDKALDDALRRAVEQAVGTVVTSDTMTERYRVIHDQILSQTSGYIRRYSILSETAEDTLYRVNIRAEVGKTNLMSDLKALGMLQVLAEKPKIMLVIEEKVAGLFGTSAWESIGQTETSMIEQFVNSGFTVVDPQVVKANISKDEAIKILTGNDQAAAVAGLNVGAQIVITGKAFSKNAGGRILNTQMQSLQGVVQARAVRTDDAQVISARSGRAGKVHLDEVQGGTLALESAGKKVAQLLIEDIIKKWRGETYGREREVTITLSGLVSYRHLVAIKTFLQKEMQGVKGVHQRSFLAGSAELSLDYSGKSSNIADELANRKFQGFRIEPLQVTLNQLDLKIVINK